MSAERREVPPQLTSLLDAWSAGAKAGPGGFPRPTMCGGALMFVTHPEAVQLEEMNDPGAIRWAIEAKYVPADGQRHSWRVRCRGEMTVSKHGYYSALCPRCEGTERAMRSKMRDRALQASIATRGPRASRRGDFT